MKNEATLNLASEIVNPSALQYLLDGKAAKKSGFFQDKIDEIFGNTDVTTFDWSSGTDNRNWWWQAQQLLFLRWYTDIRDSVDEDTKTRLRIFCKEALFNWIKKAAKNEDSPLNWHDHASAFRLRHIVEWITILIQDGQIDECLSAREQQTICAVIFKHLEFLHDKKNYSLHTNHGFDQALVVYTVSLIWNGVDAFAPYARLAKKRLKDELDFAFTAEGVHKENSPGYQRYMIGRLELIQKLKLLGETELSDTVDTLLAKVQKFLDDITLPNGRLPLIGDTRAEDKAGKAFIPQEKEVMEILNYTESGYAIIRGRTASGHIFHLIIKSAHLSDYHRHDDDLSFHLFFDDRVVFGDGGLYMYNEQDPKRLFVRSPLAHNTVFPVGYKAERQRKNLHTPPSLHYDKQRNVFTARTSCYGGVLERQFNVSELTQGRLHIKDQWIEKPKQYKDGLTANFFVPEVDTTALTINESAVKSKECLIKIRASKDTQTPIVERVFDAPDAPVIQALEFGKDAPACRLALQTQNNIAAYTIELDTQDPFLNALFENQLQSFSQNELGKHLWDFTPAKKSTPDDLDYVERIIGEARPEQLNTDLLYLSLRTHLWQKNKDKALTLIQPLLERDDATPSQKINATRQVAFCFTKEQPQRMDWTHKTLGLIHAHGYERFESAYIALSKQLCDILGLSYPKEQENNSGIVIYPDLIDYIENHIPENYLKMASLVNMARQEKSLKVVSNFFEVENQAELAHYLEKTQPYKIFAEINEAIRGLITLESEPLNNLISVCLDGAGFESFKNGHICLELAMMLNALNHGDKNQQRHIYECIIKLGKLDNVIARASTYFATGLSHYALGQYKMAETELKNFATFPTQKRLYHQSAAASFRNALPDETLEPFSQLMAGDMVWVTRIESTSIPKGSPVILISCDPGYLKVYAQDYLEQLSTVKDQTPVHFHVVSSSEEDLAKIAELRKRFEEDASIGLSYEVVSFGNLKTYSSLVRYIVTSRIMDAYESAVFISDIDLVMRQSPDLCLKDNPEKIGLFFGIQIHTYFPWQIIKAGAGLYPNNDTSRVFLKIVGSFMMYSYINGNDGWMLDQMALEYAYRNSADKSAFYSLKEAGFPITQVQDRPQRRAEAKKVSDITAQDGGLLHYYHNRNAVMARLDAMEFSNFKVALKSKDELDLLEQWIQHYGDIFGYENIVIFDNESTETEVLDVYRKYNPRLGCIMHYGKQQGGHNTIHYPDKYPDLYEKLASKCRYLALFDTDEFLYHIEDNQAYAGHYVRDLLEKEAQRVDFQKTIYTFWFNEMPEDPSHFLIGSDYIHLYKGVRDGKHFMPSTRVAITQSGHNSCAPLDLVAEEVPTNFWLFHKRTVTYERRLRVNYNKLKSRDALKPDVTLEDMIKAPSKDLLIESRATRAALSYINEVKRITDKMKAERQGKNAAPLKGGLRLDKDNKLHFTDTKSEQLVTKFITNPEVKRSLASYLKHPMTCSLNKTAMIELGVYGEIEAFDKNAVQGWFLDTLVEDAQSVELRINNHVFDEITPDKLVELPFAEEPLKAGFSYEIDKKVLKAFIKKQGISSPLKLRVIAKRVGKALKGPSQISI